jgi:hypothetical protein
MVLMSECTVSEVAVAVAQGLFGNPGRGTSAVRSQYQKPGLG